MSSLRACTQNITAKQTIVIAPEFAYLEQFMRTLPKRFADGEGKTIHKLRNELRIMTVCGQEVVVKSFRRPNIINRFVYGTLRASKAQRSFDNAYKLLAIGVGTPTPVGYINIRKNMLFDRSFYVSLRSTCPYVYDNLFYQPFDYTDQVAREVGRTTALLHQNNIAHSDYGRANILFKKTPTGVHIEIVDINRMHFGPINLKQGCKNLERLPATPHMHRLIAEEYAKIRHFDADKCFRLMQEYRSNQPRKINNIY